MRMHALPFAEERRREFHGLNSAAALLEGAVQVMDSTLKAHGGGIQTVGPVPCTALKRHVC